MIRNSSKKPTCKVCGKKIISNSGICGLCKAKKHFLTPGNIYKALLQHGVPPRIAEKVAVIYPNGTLGTNAPNCIPFEETRGKGLFYTGIAGSGKTVAAASVLLHDIECSKTVAKYRDHTRSVSFVTCQDMLDDIRRGFDSKENVVEKYRNWDLLIVDDFGTEKLTDWVFSTLYGIIDYRFNNFKKTIYTSNYSLSQLAKKLGDERITRRIHEDSDIIELS